MPDSLAWRLPNSLQPNRPRPRSQDIDLGEKGIVTVNGLGPDDNLTPEEIAQLSGVYGKQLDATPQRMPGHMHAEIGGKVYDQDGTPKRKRIAVSRKSELDAFGMAAAERTRQDKLAHEDKLLAHETEMQRNSPQNQMALAQIEQAKAMGAREQSRFSYEQSDRNRESRMRADADARKNETRANVQGFKPMAGYLPATVARAQGMLSQYDDPNQALGAAKQMTDRQAAMIAQQIQQLETRPTPENLQEAQALRRKFSEYSLDPLASGPARPLSARQAISSDDESRMALERLIARATELGNKDVGVFAGWDPTAADRAELLSQRDELAGQIGGGYTHEQRMQALNDELRRHLQPLVSSNMNAGWIRDLLRALDSGR